MKHSLCASSWIFSNPSGDGGRDPKETLGWRTTRVTANFPSAFFSTGEGDSHLLQEAVREQDCHRRSQISGDLIIRRVSDAPRVQGLPARLLSESAVSGRRIRLVAGGSQVFPLPGSVPAAGHDGSGRPVQLPGSASLRAPADRLDIDLRLQPRGVQFPTDRAALPGGSGVPVHRG